MRRAALVLCGLFCGAMVVVSDVARAQSAPASATATADSIRRWRLTPLPVLGSAPETGLQYGIALLATRPAYDGETRPTVVMSNAVRTAKSQSRAFLDVDYWSSANRWRVFGSLVLQEFPLGFWGYGADAPDSARRSFTPRTADFTLSVHRKVASKVWGYGQLRRMNTSVVAFDSLPCPDLGGPTVICLDPLKRLDGSTTLLSVGAVYDSRDNLLAPTRGGLLEVSIGQALPRFGSDWQYTRVRVDARQYHPLNHGGVLGVQFVLFAHGDGFIPINQEAVVGNNTTMRGYEMGRFLDRTLATAQVEYRTPLRGKWGGAAFVGATLLNYEIERLHESRPLPSYGAGIRYRLDAAARSAIRVDYAIGASGQRGLYVAFNEAF